MHEHADIIRDLGVAPKFDADDEIERRIEFLADSCAIREPRHMSLVSAASSIP